MRKFFRTRSSMIPNVLISIYIKKAEVNFLSQYVSEIDIFQEIGKIMIDLNFQIYEVVISELSKEEFEMLSPGVINLKMNKNGI